MNAATMPRADATIDLSGLTCPSPLLGAKRLLDDMRAGQVLALISDCPGTRDDLFIWTRHTDHELLEVDSSSAPHHVYYIRKGKLPSYDANVTLDMRGSTCPGPILEAKKVLDGMKPNEVLKLISTCAASRDEVDTWSKNTRHTLLDTREVDAGVWEFFIKRC
jgi:TusA-related sulfurtransferase